MGLLLVFTFLGLAAANGPPAGSPSARLPPRYYPVPPPSNASHAKKLNYTAQGLSATPYPIFGVNLGGWLLLEPWITPSLFDEINLPHVVDEYELCKHYGKEACKQRLERHWATFLTREDMQILKNGGINTVRIPVGYWMFGNINADEPWVTGSYAHLHNMIRICSDLGIKVLIDLHGGPGSQNGFDNSGRAGAVRWADRTGGRYYNIERTVEILRSFRSVFIDNSAYPFYDTVIGIGILNEPRWDTDMGVLRKFYTDSYGAMQAGRFDFHISDSFRFYDWANFMQPPTYENVYLDTHIYHCFDGYFLNMNWDQHVSHACGEKGKLANSPLWTVVGEWSLATTDCAKYLNGYTVPSQSRWQGEIPNYPVYGSCEGQDDSGTFSPEYRAFLKKFSQAQQDAYAGSRGWFFWTAKNEEAPQWNYIKGLQEGYILPMNSPNRDFKC